MKPIDRLTNAAGCSLSFVAALPFILLFLKQIADFVIWLQTGHWPIYRTSAFIRIDLGLPLPHTGWVEIDNLLSVILNWPSDFTIALGLVAVYWLAVWLFQQTLAAIRPPKSRDEV